MTRYDEDEKEVEEDEDEENARMKTPKTASLMSSKKYNHLQPTPLAPPIGSAVKRVLTPIANYFFSTNANDEPVAAATDLSGDENISNICKDATKLAFEEQRTRYRRTRNGEWKQSETFETPIDDPEGYERDLT